MTSHVLLHQFYAWLLNAIMAAVLTALPPIGFYAYRWIKHRAMSSKYALVRDMGGMIVKAIEQRAGDFADNEQKREEALVRLKKMFPNLPRWVLEDVVESAVHEVKREAVLATAPAVPVILPPANGGG